MGLDTLAEVADRNAANIAAAQSKKAEVSLANKAIHKLGGEDAAFEFLASGGTVSALCRTLGIGAATFDRWLDRGGEARRKAYAQARARGGQSLAEQTIEIADSATVQEVQLAKLRCDRPMEAVLGMFRFALDHLGKMATAPMTGTPLPGGSLGSGAAEWATRRWK